MADRNKSTKSREDSVNPQMKIMEISNKNKLLKAGNMDFPGGTVDKNPPANAGAQGFDPWSGKIPHAPEHLSPCATTIQPSL